MSKMSKTIAALGVVAGLGVAALPLSTYAANNTTVNLNVEVTDTIELSTSETELTLQPVNGKNMAESSAILTIATSNSKGYTLNARTAKTALVTDDGDEIAAGTPQDNATTSAWGIKGGNKVFNNYAPLTTSDQLVKTTTSKPSSGSDTVEVTFGVATAAGQNAGVYKGSVTFTATANI